MVCMEEDCEDDSSLKMISRAYSRSIIKIV